MINNDVVVIVNGVDLSNNAFNVDLNLTRDQVEVSGFNSAGAKEFLPGSKDEEVVVSFRQDFAAAKVDATLWPLYTNGSTFGILVRPTSSAASSTNPAYTATAGLYEYHPLDGAFGAASDTQVTFKLIGGVSRATA
jgi:hypothetical protein